MREPELIKEEEQEPKQQQPRRRDQNEPAELAFYSRATTDIEYAFPFTDWGELWGIADRTDYDLSRHQEASGKDLTYFTIPITADYRFNDRWKVRAGTFLSWRTDGEFSGYVTDGYLRSGIPTGEKIVYEKGQQAAYDFNDDLRSFTWGALIGGSWRAYRHFSVNVNVTYDFNNIFRSGFTTVRNTLHPIYGNIGFGYSF